DRSGELAPGIRHRVDRGLSQSQGIARLELSAAGRFDSLSSTAIKDVVFSATVEADDCPHPVVVWIERPAGRPDDVQNREGGRTVETMQPARFRRAQSFFYLSGLRGRALDDLLDRRLGHRFGQCLATVLDEPSDVEHNYRPGQPRPASPRAAAASIIGLSQPSGAPASPLYWAHEKNAFS